MKPTFTNNPTADALSTVLRAHGGLSGTLNSIEALTPEPTASVADKARFEASVAETLDETLRSLAMLTGELAFHLRRITTAEMVAASAVRSN